MKRHKHTYTDSLDIYFVAPGDLNIRLVYRAAWTFTFDRKNRLKSHTNTNTSNARTNLWYDAMGRVWQRWNDDTVTGSWDTTLARYVNDGQTLAQEHLFTVSRQDSTWVYTYGKLTRDYLRHPGGIRQRERTGSSPNFTDTDRFLLLEAGNVAARADRGSSVTVTRTMRLASGDRLPENPAQSPELTTSSFSNLSNLLGLRASLVDSFGGGATVGSPTEGFDALMEMDGRHYLAGVERYLNRRGNHPFVVELIFLALTLLLLVFLPGCIPPEGKKEKQPVSTVEEEEFPTVKSAGESEGIESLRPREGAPSFDTVPTEF